MIQNALTEFASFVVLTALIRRANRVLTESALRTTTPHGRVADDVEATLRVRLRGLHDSIRIGLLKDAFVLGFRREKECLVVASAASCSRGRWSVL